MLAAHEARQAEIRALELEQALTAGALDVTLPGAWGELLSIAIMLTGITLFLRLAQALIRPSKISFPCDRCGLSKHDPDAVHCKACGNLLCIPDEGL